MISQRFAADRAQTGELAQPVHIHLHLPPQMTAAIMQLVTALTGQRSLFSDEQLLSTQTQAVEAMGDAPPGRSASDLAATRPAPEKSGETAPPEVTPSVDAAESLLEIYLAQVRENRMRRAGKKAIAEHLSSCRLFDQWVSIHHRPRGPMVDLLGLPDLLQSYARWLLLERKIAVDTAEKRLKHVAMIARLAFKLVVDKPTATELKRIHDSVSRGVSAPGSKRRIPSEAEVDAIARAVGVAKWPYGAHAPYFWRGAVRMAALFGFRTFDVISCIPEKTGLRKQDIVWDSVCPIADVNNALGYELHSPHGWLHYAIEKDTHSACRTILLPMPKWLRDWVRFFFELSNHPERVFPSMRALSLDQKAFGREWRTILAAANVDSSIVISEGKGGKIALRKYAANWWDLATFRARNDERLAEKMSHYVLHHSEVTVAAKHYLAVQAKLLPIMLELLPHFPLPAAGAPPVSMLPE